MLRWLNGGPMGVRRWLVVAVVTVSTILVARPTAAGGPYQFYSITPCRLVDTRLPPGAPLLAGSTRNFQVAQLCGVPMTAGAAALNVTVVTPTGNWYVVVWPYNTSMPGISTISVTTSLSALANGCLVGLTTGSLNISAF